LDKIINDLKNEDLKTKSRKDIPDDPYLAQKEESSHFETEYLRIDKQIEEMIAKTSSSHEEAQEIFKER